MTSATTASPSRQRRVIGWSVGKDTYKDTGYPILPYFSWEQAKEMEASGLISIGIHTYDLHQTDWLEPNPGNVRDSAARCENESRWQYKKMFTADHERISTEMEASLGHTPLFSPIRTGAGSRNWGEF